MSKVRIDEPTAGAETAACDDCQYYKFQKNMNGEVFHFCMSSELNGYENGARRMAYKMGTCDFYSKNKKEFDWNQKDFPLAYIGVRERRTPKSKDTVVRFLSPGDYLDYMRKRNPFGF